MVKREELSPLLTRGENSDVNFETHDGLSRALLGRFLYGCISFQMGVNHDKVTSTES